MAAVSGATVTEKRPRRHPQVTTRHREERRFAAERFRMLIAWAMSMRGPCELSDGTGPKPTFPEVPAELRYLIAPESTKLGERL